MSRDGQAPRSRRGRAARASEAEALIARAAPPPGGPGADRDLWLPLGPSVTLRGDADGGPRIAGRVRDVAISEDGQRCYAATAHGGLWYSDTAGAGWEPVVPWAMVTNRADLAPSSHTLACGAVHVRFDSANDPVKDEVWVATGEPPRSRPGLGYVAQDLGTYGYYGGVGVLRAVGPVETSRISPLVDPWTREAQPRPAAGSTPAYAGLRGGGVFRLAADPANGRSLVAATTRGLHHNGTSLTPDPWAQVTVAAWEGIEVGASNRVVVTDVAWTPATGGHTSRLWVAVVDELEPALTDVWVSENGVAGPFTPVGLPGIVAGGAITVARLGLASDPAFPDVVYVLGSADLLWRIDGLAPATVTPLPTELFGPSTPVGISDYTLALAIDPGNVDRILIGGSVAKSRHDNSGAAALYRLTVSGAAPAYTTDYVGGEANDATWVGAGVRAYVHRIGWRRVGAAGQVWVCCDGGIFRSTADAAPRSFVSRSTGLAVTETGFVASHPASDGIVLAGAHDNGPQLRIGESVWRRAPGPDFGGGVAFDPGTTGRFVAQATHARWYDDSGLTIGPALRSDAPIPAYAIELSDSAFYSNPAVVRRSDGVTQLAVGTMRVWFSERWGRSRRVGNIWQREWVTLPGLADPRAGDADDAVTDVLPTGSPPSGVAFTPSMSVRAVRWAGPDRLYVVVGGAIHRLDRNPPTTGSWALATILTRRVPPVTPAPSPWPVAGAELPEDGVLNDLAVHNASAGLHGSFYVATSHPLEPVWWFDGVGRLHPARLGTPDPPAPPVPANPPLPPDGVRAPAYAVVVDPDDPRIVYVGTTVGVWRGELTLGATPSWVWRPYSSGLPEAAVQDLSITTWSRPAGPPLKLLRAASQSRGVWEVEPDLDALPTTYLRVHPYDSRRIAPTDLRDPMWRQPRPERAWSLDWADLRNRDYRDGANRPRPAPDGTPIGSFRWHGSPDIRLRPARAVTAVPSLPPNLPWTTAPPDRFWLWSLQTALRTIDPLIVPDGRWTPLWRTRLAEARVAVGLDPTPFLERVDDALWLRAPVQAAFWADPWADGGPTEADLIERVFGAPTPRVGGPNAPATSPASLAVLRRPYRVDVCLHHRGREELFGSTLAVILLRLQLPADPTTWAGLGSLALPAGPALTALRAALDALPSAGGAVPAQLALPAGWAAADVGVAVRRPDRPVATGAPVVLTFSVDFSAAAAGSRWLFVALAHSTIDPLALTGADLRTMVLRSRHAAARSVEVV